MDQLVLDVSATPSIKLTSIGGDLRLTGWDQNQLFAEGEDESQVHLDRSDDEILVRSDGNCTVRLPRGATTNIKSVGGDARIKGLQGPLDIRNVGGDLILRQTAAVTVQAVGGDLSAKRVEGALVVETVSGDLLARSVEGDFSVRSVTGDLYLRDVSGSITGTATSDVTLSVDFRPGQTYQLAASGDIVCRLPAGAAGRFEVQASGEISVDVPDAQVQGVGNQRVVLLGSGEPTVRLQSSGDVVLAGPATDAEAMGDFGERFGEEFGVMAEELGAQIEAQMADLERQLSEQFSLEFGTSRIKAEDIAARARRAAERVQEAARRRAQRQAEAATRRVEAARRRAQREAERAQRLAETAQRRAEAAQRRAAHKTAEHHGRHSGAWAFDFAGSRGAAPAVPPVPPVPPAEPVSDEERMAILRMVEQGKITVADAEKLLAALEGK